MGPRKRHDENNPEIRPYMLNGQAIWKDPTSKAFFTWGGWKGTSTPWDKKIVQFTANDTGGGHWQDITPPNLLAIARTREGTFSQSNNVGYYFGGYTTRERTPIAPMEVNHLTQHWETKVLRAALPLGSCLLTCDPARCEVFHPAGLVSTEHSRAAPCNLCRSAPRAYSSSSAGGRHLCQQLVSQYGTG